MGELLFLLVIVGAIAVIWYLRRRSSGLSAQPEGVGRRLTVETTGTKRGTISAQLTPPETGPPACVPGKAEKGAVLFQGAAASAAGTPYARAADEIPDITAELSHARPSAERAAERLANRGNEAIEASQAAAVVDGGAVTGDGSARCPPRYPVKGDLVTMRYQNPGVGSYDQVTQDVCFQSVAAAEAARLTESGDENRL